MLKVVIDYPQKEEEKMTDKKETNIVSAPPPEAKSIKLGGPKTEVKKETEEKKEPARVEGVEFKEEDLVAEAIRMINTAMERSRKNKFKRSGFTYQELEFLLKIVNITNTKVMQMNQLVGIYSSRDQKLRQKILEVAELVQLKIKLV